MASSGFGRTWWGSAWIEALEKSDIGKARLEEGRAYAAKGYVKGIRFENREVLSSVQDQETYEPKLRLIEFNEKEKAQIENIIKENPALASELSLGRLEEEIIIFLRFNTHLIIDHATFIYINSITRNGASLTF